MGYRISPALYGSRAAVVDGITSAEINLGPEPPRNGMFVIPSAARLADGNPRFHLPVPAVTVRDVSTQLLIAYETFHGFEAPYRLFLGRHIEPGDVFIDAGAHWGLYSVDIATSATPEVTILACEPVAPNLEMLRGWLHANRAETRVEVIPCALADFEGEGGMILGNYMTGRLAQPAASGPSRHPVRVTTVDAILRERPTLRGRRIFLKVDVEGAECAVLEGAREALDSGRVAAIVVEYHPARGDAQQLGAMIETLRAWGYRLARFPHHHMGGALLDFAPDDTVCNVIALGPGLNPEPAYLAPYRGFAPLPPPYYEELDAPARTRRDAILREWRATDGARWSDPRSSAPGAGERARLVAADVKAGERVLDLGAGCSAQKSALPPRCAYLGVDLIQRDADTLVLDLNRGEPDSMRPDHVIASRIIEHLYDPLPLLQWCAAHATALTCVHALGMQAAGGGTTTAEGIITLLRECGWRVLDTARHGDDLVCRCASR